MSSNILLSTKYVTGVDNLHKELEARLDALKAIIKDEYYIKEYEASFKVLLDEAEERGEQHGPDNLHVFLETPSRHSQGSNMNYAFKVYMNTLH